MKKIGIVTLYGNHNIGNRLQSYAVMRLYRSLGYEAVAINYREPELSHKATLMEWAKWALKEVLSRVCPNIHPKLRRRRLFLEFTKNYLRPSQFISIRHIPPDLKRRYEFFSVGSDQVWRNWSDSAEEKRFFFLQFAKRRQRLCLSPSFGLERVPEEETAVYREGLDGFPRLSCREISGVKLIRDLTGRDAELLLDPTMALPVEEWERLERRPSYSLPERYILSYMVGSIQDGTENALSHYSRLLHMDVVNIDSLPNIVERYAATGPREFLYLIRHARLICTNSFHGTVFSILFRRDFLYFKRNDFGGDMNRVTTLLDRFNLMSRRYGVVRDEDLLLTDYTGAEEILTLERKRILDYLRESIADNG